jgi:hypothetical protein
MVADGCRKERQGREMPNKQWSYVSSPAIPDTVRIALKSRLEHHVAQEWKGHCHEIILRFRGRFAYVDALTPLDDFTRSCVKDEGELKEIEAMPTHLCRLGYLGSVDHWEFAFYKYSDERYEPCYLPSGSFVGTPEECFDCAAGVYL